MFSRILLLSIFLFSFIFRLFYVSHFNFAFTFDQAHDMLEIRRLAIGHELVFTGPPTSLNGLYYGPLWFYYNLPAFILGKGDPTALVYWEIIFYFLLIFSFFLFFVKKLPSFAFFSALFLLLAPRIFGATSYALNSNTTPAFILLFILLLYQTLQKKTALYVFLLGLLSGLTLQIEAFGILMFPLGIFWLYRFKVKRIFLYIVGFSLTLLPQVLRETTHRFPMTKVFLAEFAGSGNILGDKISLSGRLVDRFQHYAGELNASFPFGYYTIAIFFLIIFLFVFTGLRNQKINSRAALLLKLNLSLLIISVIFFMIYPNRLKDWWTINFVIPYILIFSVCLAEIWNSKKIFLRASVAIVILFAISGGLFFYRDKLFEKLLQRSDDPGSLANQIEAVDWVYEEANGEGFKVYAYTPAIYDYNYQYLFWWYGRKRYGYQPDKITYQDNVPEYIKDNGRYWTVAKKLSTNPLTFLIVEPDANRAEARSAWLDHFRGLCLVSGNKFPSQIETQLREPCPPAEVSFLIRFLPIF